MDFEEENIYTMQCGGGSDGDSDSNSSAVEDADIDRADEDQGYSEAEAQSAGVDTSQDSSFSDDSPQDIDRADEKQDFSVSPSSPTNTDFSTNFSTDAGFLTSPEITLTPQAPGIEEITQDDADSTSADFSGPDVGDTLSGGDPSEGATYKDVFNAATTGKITSQLSLPARAALTVGGFLLGGFPLSLATGALMSYTQSRGITTQTASNTSDSMSGLLSDSTFDSGSDAADNNTFITRGLLQNPNTSPAVQFLANVRQSSVMDRYNAAKERINSSSVAVTPFGRLAVSASPFYNFLEQRNLNRGIL